MRLVVFDIDGTLVDSQHHIHQAMSHAFEFAGLNPLPPQQVLALVGLSLPVAVSQLVPQADAETQARIVAGYRTAFVQARMAEEAPLYPGALDCLDTLWTRSDLMLGVATGKSRRGLETMIEVHGLKGRFVTLQTADTHPSKPAPDMLLAALEDTGISADHAVMVGDTTFDMQMAIAAGTDGFGVEWGYHPAAALREAGATLVVPDFSALTAAIEEWAE